MSIARFVPGSDDVFYHLDSKKVTTMGFLNEELFGLYEEAIAVHTAAMVGGEANETKPVENTKGNILQFPGPKSVH